MPALRAEIMAIGDELTSGQRIDTNSVWLSGQLGEMGIEVRQHTTVGDDIEVCRLAFQQAAERADVVVVTGGLGPTADDLTRQALAEAAGVQLVLDDASLAHLVGLYTKRGRAMPEANRIQAYFPQGSRVVPNPNGTAPGLDCEITRPTGGGCRFFCLPGVPSEMHAMWEQTVAPAILEMPAYARQTIRYRSLKCFGVGESDLEAMLPDLIRRGREPKVGITVHQATITLRIAAAGADEAACLAAMEPTVTVIHERLGLLVFGEESDELEHAVARLLAQQGKTLATGEADTAGLLAHWLGAIEGNANYLGSLTAAELEGASPHETPASESEEDSRALAERLAVAARERFAADLGLGISTIPAEAVDCTGEPARVAYALATAEGVQFGAPRLFGPADLHRPRVTKAALDLARKHLLGNL